MHTTKKPRKPFNLLLNERERSTLNDLAESMQVSHGQVLRSLIMNAGAHKTGSYCCSDGTPCFVPQMHLARIPQCQNQ